MTGPDAVNILVVDDVPDKLLALRTLLEGPGRNVVTAQSGREALRRLLDQEFAVILLDVNMPDMDGFETAALIRQRKQTAATPIIFVTGYGDEMHTAQGYSLGAVDYILTPVVPDILKTKVNVFVELFRMREQVKRQAEQRVALAREQALRAAAEEATRRSQFLAEATATLTGSLDFEATVRGLLRLVVPRLADVAAVTQAGEGSAWHSELAWTEPPDPAVRYRTLTGAEAPRDELRAAHDRVLAAGAPEVLDGLTVPYPPGCQPAGTLRAALVLPLLARGRALGVLTLARCPARGSFAPADRALAEDLAGRAAIALDNARLYRDIREADRRKDEFLAMLAHELRNPLAPVRSAVEILRRVAPDQPQLSWARGVIDRQVQHIVRLVDDLLDVSRITRGVINLKPTRVELAASVARALETSRPLIDSRRHVLTTALPDEPLYVVADPTRLDQVIANLLNNAAKYTEPGGRIELTVRGEAGEAVLTVRDNGVGIPAEMLERIFEPFTQVERTLDRSQGGLGIGLTLVQRLVAMQGGRVRARSDGPGKGSEFEIRLPLAPAAAPAPAAPSGNGEHPVAAAAPAPPRQAGARRILVVDDNGDAAQTLAVFLRSFDHDVRVAHDGPAALDEAAAFAPDLVVLDIGLPGMDGCEVARRLRELPLPRRPVLVALTGYGQEQDLERTRQAGFDRHFVKPIEPDVLRALAADLPSAAPPAAVGP